MRLMRTIFLVLPILWGCGSAQAVLKTPVESKCGSAGLKGCPEMTEGVLLYIGGEEAKGKDMLTKGAAENTPAKVRRFAKAIKTLKQVPGASGYTAKLVEVADILTATHKGAPASPDDEAGDDEDAPAAKRPKGPKGFDGLR